MISIVEAAARYAVAKGIKQAGLMSTSFTMSAGFFQEVFTRYGVEVVIPSEEDRNYINEKLFTEIELGVFKPATRGGTGRRDCPDEGGAGYRRNDHGL